MTEPVNLNRFRKAKAKTEAKATAAENRVRFGRSKAEQTRVEAEREKAARDLDGDGLIESMHRTGVSGTKQWSTCWFDVISFGWKDAFANAILYGALKELSAGLRRFDETGQAQTVAQLVATVQANEAAVRNARVSLGYTRITAPISGVTGLRLVDAGNIVEPGSTTGLVVVTQVTPISVLFTLPEQSLAEIRAAGGKGVTVLAYDRDNARQIASGELTVVDNQIDATTGTIRLKATFANSDRALWPGQFVNMRLLVRTEKNGLVIPASAVQRGPNGDFVYVENKDASGARIADKRDISVARSENGTALIAKGLNDGDRIVVEGQYRLQPGAKIRLAADPAPAADTRPKGK